MENHQKRGTWNIDGVRELSELMEECRKADEDIILGAVHPIMGAKGSESQKAERVPEDLRVRTVFTALVRRHFLASTLERSTTGSAQAQSHFRALALCERTRP